MLFSRDTAPDFCWHRCSWGAPRQAKWCRITQAPEQFSEREGGRTAESNLTGQPEVGFAYTINIWQTSISDILFSARSEGEWWHNLWGSQPINPVGFQQKQQALAHSFAKASTQSTSRALWFIHRKSTTLGDGFIKLISFTLRCFQVCFLFIAMSFTTFKFLNSL